MKLITNKRHAEQLAAARQQGMLEAKGYYARSDEEVNQYLRIIASQAAGMVEMQPIDQVDRAKLKSLYLSNGPLYGVIDKIATAVAVCSRSLELTDKTGKPVEKHFILDVLNRPNDRFSRGKFFYAAATNRFLFGDEWNCAPKSVGKVRGVKEMYVISSDSVGVKHGNGKDEPMFDGLVIAGKPVSAADVFENFAYNPDDKSFFGVSKASVAAAYLTILERAAAREATALKNGGAANLIAPADSGTPALPQDVDKTEEKVNKPANLNKTMMVRIPVAVHTLGDKPADLAILESSKDAVTALCFVYGVPVDLYYGQAKYENMKEAKKALYESVAIPFIEEWCEDFINYLGLAGQYTLKVNVDKIDVLQRDPYAAADNMAKIGAFTTNEIRETAGWERIPEPWADEVRIPLGVQIGANPEDFSEV